jgi:hypothetical protein
MLSKSLRVLASKVIYPARFTPSIRHSVVFLDGGRKEDDALEERLDRMPEQSVGKLVNFFTLFHISLQLNGFFFSLFSMHEVEPFEDDSSRKDKNLCSRGRELTV